MSRLARSYEAVPHAVVDARAAVKAWLRGLPIEEASREDIALALSEACSNAVLHAYPDATGRFRVFAEWDGETVALTVADDGCGMLACPAAPGLGLGLPLIAALTETLDVRPGPDGHGTEASMRFAVMTTSRSGRNA
jgi:serine/threonine-protein kinase RsbW